MPDRSKRLDWHNIIIDETLRIFFASVILFTIFVGVGIKNTILF